MDWNLARTRRAESGGSVWFAGDRTRACRQPGGVAFPINKSRRVRLRTTALVHKCTLHKATR